MPKKTTSRRVDPLGRIFIPSEIRCELNIRQNDKIDFKIKGDAIVLTRDDASCVFCQHRKVPMKQVKDKFICDDCIKLLQNE